MGVPLRKYTEQNSATMKNTVTLFTILLFCSLSMAQSSDYQTLWDRVKQHEINGLPKSALQVTETIYKKAKADNNSSQLIKALLFKSKFALILEEDAQLNIINSFKTEIAQSKFPSKNILESILANLYWQYFNQNRYKFYNRTKTAEKVDSVDFRTWDLQTLFNEIHIHYQNALQNGLMLQLEPLEQFDDILNLKKDSKTYRPTLFDFISHHALEFYKTKENNITKPAYKFEIDHPDFLSNVKTFSVLNINSKDPTSLQLNALKIYQELVAFHHKNKSPYALAHVNIERLKFVNTHATFSNKQTLLLKALKTERDLLKQHEVSALYNFEIASIYYDQSKTYQPNTNETSRWKAKEALELCNKVMSTFPKSKGAEHCKVLKQQIQQQSLQITTENFLPIQQHGRLLVQYKNIETLQFNVYKLTKKQRAQFNTIYRQNEQQAFIKKLNSLKSWTTTLRNENDYQTHTTEVVIPKLNNGLHLIVATQKQDEENFAFANIQVTNFALAEKETETYKIFQFIDRNNGTPIAGAPVTFTFSKRNQRKQQSKTFTTNAFGEIKIKKEKNIRYHNASFIIKHNNEIAYLGNYYINQYYKQQKEKTNYRSFLFTDRSIYRPGQTIYFKAIAMKTTENKSEVLADENASVTLYNVNGEEVKILTLKTNDFGSVAGEFILPSTGLTGQYRITFNTNSGYKNIANSTYFSVEEYKRPKFKTSFLPVSKTFKINDSVTVKGQALAYAGSAITDAKVTYRVYRKVQYPRFYWYRPWFNSEPQEITHGTSTTNSKGEFEITFKALPDESADKNNLPVFNYEVTADVTDINGETRSTSTVVKVGYHALIANVHIESLLNKTKKDHSLSIETKNLNGEFVPAKGSVKIYKLLAPKQTLRLRPWPAPDYQDISKDTFKSMFPHDAYANEHDANYWEKGELVFKKPFNTKDSETLKLGKLRKWDSGQYIIVLETKDKFGQIVKDEIKTTLFSPKDNTLVDKQLFNITTDKTTYKTEDNAILTLASSAKHITVTVAVEKKSQIVKTQTLTLNNNKKTITIPVEKDDLGGFSVHYSFAAYNSYVSGIQHISVPYPEKHLTIETKTFRDKLQPGTDETWSFKIKGTQVDKVSAELLASMYDASLDQFRSHSWHFAPVYNSTYYAYGQSRAHQSFGTRSFRVYNILKGRSHYPKQEFDALNWFGFSLTNKWMYNNYLRILKLRQESKFDSSIKKGIVSGTVLDENGNPLPGVNIIIKGTSTSTFTDFDGNFSIEADKKDTLTFTYIGFITRQIKIKNENHFIVTLPEDMASLNEVVVVGYGSSVRSKAITGIAHDEIMMVSESLEEADTDDGFALEKNSTPVASKDTIDASSGNGKTPNFDNITIRKNLQETAFFFPQLQTDKDGNVSFNFTTPEALTTWDLQLLAHTKTLENTSKTLTAVTQKDLMVIPNSPRFLREGDQITISTKIANLSKKTLTGDAILVLTDAVSGASVDTLLNNSKNTKAFTIDPEGNTQVSWHLNIPDNVQAVQYKIMAKAGDFSDGEQNVLPVLSNRMLVTETLPMWVRSDDSRTFSLDKLKNNTSTTLKNHKLTLEVTSNPAWYAVQALPYLMEYPYQCNEQTFSRYYANALASHIANSNPKIQAVFNQWKSQDALLSNLEKNAELKSLLIQETPWLRDAQSETEQKKRIALLFDLNKMRNELQSNLRKLQNNQMYSGAWPWFNGGRENRYITQHIVSGFGHLKHLNVNIDSNSNTMLKRAITYLDDEFVQMYKDIRKYDAKVDLNKDHLNYTQLHYLYMRSFFPEIKTSKVVNEVIAYYQTQIQKYWLKRSLYAKGLMALISFRNNNTKTATTILKSLKENSITSDELGMYWKDNTSSWFWYQAPIETQALLIETFSEIENDTKTIDNLKIWLLKNKQTNRWKTTKATTDAVYALLLQGSDWLSVNDMVDVTLGGQTLDSSKLENVKAEAGTGYYKTSWSASEITPQMGEVTITKKGEGIAWGGLYWQYFEDLDKISSAETPLQLKKKLFLKTNSDTGEIISEITEHSSLKVGDLVRVRIELRSDRAMEFVHMKDMRASGLEPINVLSQYKWQDGLGYYESTKDASTNFFFDYLPKGVYVFEYDLRVNHAGDMSNGITTIQSMYAPEFSSHSEGLRVVIK